MYIISRGITPTKKKNLYIYLLGSRYTLYNFDNVIIFDKYFLGENLILVHTFCGHSQFGPLHFGSSQFSPYILAAINLVLIIFNLQSI